MSANLDAHYPTIIRALTQGRLVPFLGAGANACGRPEGHKWDPQRRTFLPTGTELARYLASSFTYPKKDAFDLARVAQYVSVTSGDGPLFEELRTLFDADYPFTPLHELLRAMPALLRQKGYPKCYQLIITTNYDDMLERAFKDQPFDLVSYVSEGSGQGMFMHRPPDGEPRIIEKANEYAGIPLDEADRSLKRTVILKLHGAVDRKSTERDSFVITEDHYIDYLALRDISNLLPQALHEKLKRSHFLFLGYGLKDWNLRVILQRIWGEQKLKYNSWAIQLDSDELDQKFWSKRDVEILKTGLDAYVAGLAKGLEALDQSAQPE
jgi:hypothetical protein